MSEYSHNQQNKRVSLSNEWFSLSVSFSLVPAGSNDTDTVLVIGRNAGAVVQEFLILQRSNGYNSQSLVPHQKFWVVQLFGRIKRETNHLVQLSMSGPDTQRGFLLHVLYVVVVVVFWRCGYPIVVSSYGTIPRLKNAFGFGVVVPFVVKGLPTRKEMEQRLLVVVVVVLLHVVRAAAVGIQINDPRSTIITWIQGRLKQQGGMIHGWQRLQLTQQDTVKPYRSH